MDHKEKILVPITTPFIKLDNFLKFSGMAVTGGQAKQLVEEGGILVEGQPCTMRGKKLTPGMQVQVGDTLLEVTCAD